MRFCCAEGTRPTGGAAKQTDSKLHLLFFFFAFALFSAVLIFKRSGEKKRAALNSVNEVTSEKTEKIPSVICSALPVSLPGKTTRFYLELTAAT